MTYQIGTSAVSLDPASDYFQRDPRSVYAPGAFEDDHGGGVVVVGYPRSTWKYEAILLSDYEAFVTAMGFSTGEYSGEVYLETRDEFDTWAVYRAIMRLPNPATLRRWGTRFVPVEIEFVLVEEIP